MQYIKYYEKISVIARIWGIIKRFRILILSIIGVCLALTSTFLGVQGCVYDVITCPESVSYGDSLSYDAAALFRDVRYEYSEDAAFSTVWNEPPKYPGEYYVRAVSTSSFGKTRYGQIHAYTILPKNIDVWVDSPKVPYGDLPTVAADLPYGDSISCSTFTYADPTQTQTAVIPVTEGIVVLNAQGDDVTSAYVLNPIQGEIQFIPREITVTVSNAENIYDSFPFSFDGYELTAGTMATHEDGSADRLIATFRDSITDVGCVPNTPEIKVVGFDNLDVTANYRITLVSGLLTVHKYPIQIHVQDASLEYSGAPQAYREFRVSENTALADGHVASVTASTKVTDASTVDNLLLFDIHDRDGRNVTENYSIFVSEASITVLKREITVTTSDNHWVYDGSPHTGETFTVTSEKQIASGETASVSASTAISNVASSGAENRLEISLTGTDGRDVTGNYAISYVYGTLTMEPKVIHFTSEDMTFEYDGTTHTHDGFSISATTPLVKGHSATVKKTTGITNVSDGAIKNRLELTVQDGSGNDQTPNYTFMQTAGTLTVTPRPITVTADSEERIYDGTPLQGSTVTVTNLPNGQTLTATLLGTQTDVGSSAVTVEESSVAIAKGDAPILLDNYVITFAEGTLTVQKRPVTVLSDDHAWVYDGEAHSWGGHTVSTETPLVEGHRTETLTLTEITNVWENGLSNQITVELLDSADTNVTANYEITYRYGELTIDPLPITVITEDRDWVYDGQAHGWGGHAVSAETPLVEGHTTKVDTLLEITNVWDGPTENSLTVVVLDATEADMTQNYDITYRHGMLTIDPLPITVITEDRDWIYDGQTHSWDGHKVSEQTPLVEGHTTKVDTLFEITNVGDSPAKNALTVVILDATEADMTQNYAITYQCGTLVIDPLTVTVITEDQDWVYDGQAHSWDGHTLAAETPLVAGHRTEVTSVTEITNVWDGPADNNLTVMVLNAAGEDMTQNYTISYAPGTLVIHPRPLTVITENGEWTYDGLAHSQGAHAVSEATRLVAGHRTEVDTLFEITNVWDGPAENALTVKVLDSANADMTANYDIFYERGTLIVHPRPVTIITEDHEWTYDGQAHGWGGHTVSDQTRLVEGHRTEVDTLFEITNVWDGPADNNLTVIILDASDVEMTENYTISYTPGTLVINPRPVTIITEGHTWTYDGKPHSWDVHTVSADTPLVAGHRTEVDTLFEITNVWEGPAKNALTVVILNSDDADMTENYKITYECGDLIIDPLPITIITEGHQWLYDGQAHGWGGHHVSESTPLVAGHRTEIDTLFEISNVWEGPADNALTVKVLDPADADMTENYKITYECGKLIIDPLPITVITHDMEWVYDGQAHGWGGHHVSESTPLVAGHRSEADTLFTITNVPDGPAKNALTVKVLDNDNEDMTGNYIITYEYGTLVITPRPIVVLTASDRWEYDGEAHHNPTSEAIGEYSLVLDHKLVAIGPFTYITEVGTVANTLNVMVVDGEGNSCMDNYEILRYECGILEVYKRKITIAGESATKEYDGTPLSCNRFLVYRADGKPALVLDHAVDPSTVTVEGSVTEVEKEPTPNVVTGPATILTADGRDVTGNYEITYENGKLWITPRKIILTSGSAQKIYDGTPLTCNAYTITRANPEEMALVLNHKLVEETIVITGSITEAGTEPNTIRDADQDPARICDPETGRDVTHNYAVTYVEGILQIIPRKLYIVSGSDSKIYDGKPLTCSTFEIVSRSEEDGLLEGHTVDDSGIRITGTITLPGSTPNTIDGEVKVFADSRPVTHNYEIILEAGTLSILEPPEDSLGGGVADDGKIFGGGDDDLDTPSIVLRVWSTESGPVYLRYKSFGSYTGQGWAEAPAYGERLDEIYAYTYLSGIALKNAGYKPATMRVKTYSSQLFLPTYLAMDEANYDIQGNDVMYSGDMTEFELLYYNYRGYGTGLTGNLGSYSRAERDYRRFVHNNYLNMYDNDTVLFMQEIIAKEGFSPDDPQIIKKVAEYIQNAADYNLDYDQRLNEEENIVISFLRDYKEGICQHYAAAATLLYRALGFPARWTLGYTGNTVANEWVDIMTPGHAWVEVYIDGVGWIFVEVTGGDGGIGGAGGNFEEETLPEETDPEETDPDETDPDETDPDETDPDKEEGTAYGGDINDSGNIEGGGSGSGSIRVIAMEVWSTTSGPVYLRYRTFGNFTGQGWVSDPPEYSELLDELYSYNYLSGIAMKNVGLSPATMRVHLYGSQMFLPYYMDMGDYDYDIQTSDVIYSGNTTEYELQYYAYTGAGADLIGNLGEYAELELLYREFVHNNYLDMYDNDTIQFMEEIIAENGFSRDDPFVVQKVAQYIQKAAVYNMDYDQSMNEQENIVIAFLRDYKEGICQHYAAAATMLYRALGIPARWTLGYAGNSTANEWVEITTMQAHAWVEVYIDGVGWIYVEVTGGIIGGGLGGNGDGGGSASKKRLEIRPIDVVEAYTGEPHYAVPELEVEFGSLLEELLAKGYTYEVEVYGSRVEIGESASGISRFILRDPNGRDVTDQFEVIFQPGLIRVTQDQIIINLFDLQKFYDGTELRYAPDDYWYDLPEGYRVILDLSVCAITDAGELPEEVLYSLPITILDPDGKDVTDQYYIKFVGQPLRIDKRAITLVAASEDKPYDGKPLTCDSVSILFGQLVEGHVLTAHAIGSITVEGTTENVVDETTLKIVDKNGNDVTDCYKITCLEGVLEVTP